MTTYGNDIEELKLRMQVAREFMWANDFYFLKKMPSAGTMFEENIYSKDKSWEERCAWGDYLKREYYYSDQNAVYAMIANGKGTINSACEAYEEYSKPRMDEYYKLKKDNEPCFRSMPYIPKKVLLPQVGPAPKPTPKSTPKLAPKQTPKSGAVPGPKPKPTPGQIPGSVPRQTLGAAPSGPYKNYPYKSTTDTGFQPPKAMKEYWSRY